MFLWFPVQKLVLMAARIIGQAQIIGKTLTVIYKKSWIGLEVGILQAPKNHAH